MFYFTYDRSLNDDKIHILDELLISHCYSSCSSCYRRQEILRSVVFVCWFVRSFVNIVSLARSRPSARALDGRANTGALGAHRISVRL